VEIHRGGKGCCHAVVEVEWIRRQPAQHRALEFADVCHLSLIIGGAFLCCENRAGAATKKS